jgi:hypothetical protein
MGIICSNVPEIDDLYFHELPSSRPLIIRKAVRVGRTIILVGKNGKLYSNTMGKFAYVPGQWPWMTDTMKSLLKLGVITKEQMDAHIDHCDRKEKAKQIKYAKKDIERIIKNFGVEFAEQQIAKISS